LKNIFLKKAAGAMIQDKFSDNGVFFQWSEIGPDIVGEMSLAAASNLA
jgi:hypothetical protein